MTKLVIISAAALLSATSAFAQTTSPATTPPATPSTPAPASSMPSNAPSTTVAPTGQLWYVAGNADMRASKMIGTAVRNTANESIGDINEIVLDSSGKVAAVIVGVGGFLGMGEREVAINFNALRMSRDSSGNSIVTVNATKESLKAAPAWTWKRS